METLFSYKLEKFPFADYSIVGDLIEFQGSPILVHYKKDDRNAFYYWVEGDSKFNRWLCFEVTLTDFYDYLLKELSLYQLIEKKQHEAFVTVDIDSGLNYTNFQMVYGYAIPNKYLPDKESYYIEDISEYYTHLFEPLKDSHYVELMLLRDSIALKIKPPDPRGAGASPYYDGTVSLKNGESLFKNIDISQKKFTAIEF